MKTLVEVFDVHFNHLKYDKKLANTIYKFQLDYLNSNREYLDFYSSNMLGVHRVRFKVSDYNRFMYEVLEVDTDQLNKDLDDVPSVMKINSVTSDLLNLSCVYLLHKFSNSNLLTETDRQRVSYDIASLFFMRCFAALISDYFTYPAEERIVKLAYSNLSGNSLIKKQGNWFKVVDYRAKALIDKKGIHYKTIKYLLEDKVAYVISDSKDRVKDTIKNYYREIVKVRDSGDTIGTISSTAVDMEGVMGLVDRINQVETKSINIKDSIANSNLINSDYIYLIVAINSNTNSKSLRDILQWITDNYMKEQNTIDELIESIARYTHYLLKNKVRNSSNKDIGKLLTELKGLYVSNKVQDVELDKVRDMCDNIIMKAKKKQINKGLALATRTALILYISLLYIH